ncbi:hypothetical protein PENTCL1PPCAC_29008, partial [Pristionchus entomophagus]
CPTRVSRKGEKAARKGGPSTKDCPRLLLSTMRLLFLIFVSSSVHAQDDLGNFQKMMKGFFKMSDNIPLTPNRRSNFGSAPLRYKYVDKTEYAANKGILDQVFESDLVLTTSQMSDVIADFQERVTGKKIRRRAKRKAIIGDRFRWPNATVPYSFKHADGKWVSVIRKGMAKWERETCIRFVPHTGQHDSVEYFRGGGCYSSVGRIGGKQWISIGYGCEGGGIVAHEIGHALGFWHEQSRPDRDTYININEDHIVKGTKGNFEKRMDIEDKDIPYDFGSVMHYGPQAFTNDWKYVTIETKDHRFQHTIGQRADISFVDVKHANRLYCSHMCKISLNCENGGYEDPLDCTKCKCPPGLGGTRCDRIATSTPGCGGEVLVTGLWQTLSNSKIGECYWKLYTPMGKIHFEVLESNYKCDSSCADNYLEIKHTSKLEQTGFRQCCNAVPGPIISEGNEIIISSVAVERPANFTIRYILDSSAGLPKPPPAAWEGAGGLTSLLGSEAGIDNTFEKYVLTQLPNVLHTTSAQVPNIMNLIQAFLGR